MSVSDIPVSGADLARIQELYKDASGKGVAEEVEGIDTVEGPYGIVDPRYVGYTYLSYMFIETKGQLEAARAFKREQFTQPHKALMMGVVFGEFDLIHRRADVSQYMHAEFSVRAKDNHDLRFFQDIETYPIFSVGRWHGQDVKGEMTLKTPPREFKPIEAEILVRKIESPNLEATEIKQSIIDDIERGLFTLVSEETIRSQGPSDIQQHVARLKQDALIGSSISTDVSGIRNLEHVVVGLSLGEREEDEDGDLMPNEQIMLELMDEYDGWKMPYIVTGVGQNWADIILEMHIAEVSEMNEIALNMREIDGVESTRTLLVSDQNFGNPLLINEPSKLPIV